MKREKIFSVPRKDLRVEYFRASGPGGQKVNKTSSACRITHIPSGAVASSQEERHQIANRKRALQKLVRSDKFIRWAKVQAAMILQGYRDLEDKVNRELKSDRIKVEYITVYVCDGCNTKEEVITTESIHKIPDGWVEEQEHHYCSKCGVIKN